MGEGNEGDTEVPARGTYFIRTVPSSSYVRSKGRFASSSFDPSDDGSGISIFDENCALAASGSICMHIQNFYPSLIKDNVAAYFRAPYEMLPDGVIVEWSLSST